MLLRNLKVNQYQHCKHKRLQKSNKQLKHNHHQRQDCGDMEETLRHRHNQTKQHHTC